MSLRRGPRGSGATDALCVAGEASQGPTLVADGQIPVGELVHEDGAAHEVVAVPGRLELEDAPLEVDGVVLVDDALVLRGEQQREVDAHHLGEGTLGLRGAHGEAAVEVGEEHLGEVAVGSLVGANAGGTQLLGSRPWIVLNARSERPRASGERAKICRMPSTLSARATWPCCSASGPAPASLVVQKWLPRSV